jgi:hypothetical protein
VLFILLIVRIVHENLSESVHETKENADKIKEGGERK